MRKIQVERRKANAQLQRIKDLAEGDELQTQ